MLDVRFSASFGYEKSNEKNCLKYPAYVDNLETHWVSETVSHGPRFRFGHPESKLLRMALWCNFMARGRAQTLAFLEEKSGAGTEM